MATTSEKNANNKSLSERNITTNENGVIGSRPALSKHWITSRPFTRYYPLPVKAGKLDDSSLQEWLSEAEWFKKELVWLLRLEHYRSDLPILTLNKAFRNNLVKLLTNRTKLPDWDGKIFYVDKTTLAEQRRLYNTSVAYLTELEISNRLITVQKKLQIKGYHIAQRGILRSMAYYLVNEEFPFLERLDEIFHRLRSAGLLDLWTHQAHVASEKIIMETNTLLKNKKSSDNNNRGNNSLPIFLVCGWFASTISFAFEVIWFNITQNASGIFRRNCNVQTAFKCDFVI